MGRATKLTSVTVPTGATEGPTITTPGILATLKIQITPTLSKNAGGTKITYSGQSTVTVTEYALADPKPPVTNGTTQFIGDGWILSKVTSATLDGGTPTVVVSIEPSDTLIED